MAIIKVAGECSPISRVCASAKAWGSNPKISPRRNDVATLTMEKRKDAAAPHAPHVRMVPWCHGMAAIRGADHMNG